ncbi:hypothetical protein ACU4IU_12580 [Brevibacterium sp. CSND-B09]|uniref:hypothetical protein n=1 Tax=Brevibacterium sp. CSND-B09 TaxID=3462571 RepID=UPI00406A940A
MARKSHPKRGEPRVFESIAEAAAEGTELEYLLALQRKLARTLDASDTPPYALAGLSKQFNEVSRLVEEKRVKAREHLKVVESPERSAFDAKDI